jgi:hypothetical protein
VPQPLGQCTFTEAEGEGVEPPRLYARSASNGVPSPIGLSFQKSKTPATRENIESAQRESNPHFRLGKAVGYRYIMGTVHRGRIVKDSESTGWDSNPRFRVTKAESSPLDHQCKMRSELRVGPEGLEPSPTWLRAGRAAANTLVPHADRLEKGAEIIFQVVSGIFDLFRKLSPSPFPSPSRPGGSRTPRLAVIIRLFYR